MSLGATAADADDEDEGAGAGLGTRLVPAGKRVSHLGRNRFVVWLERYFLCWGQPFFTVEDVRSFRTLGLDPSRLPSFF